MEEYERREMGWERDVEEYERREMGWERDVVRYERKVMRWERSERGCCKPLDLTFGYEGTHPSIHGPHQ